MGRKGRDGHAGAGAALPGSVCEQTVRCGRPGCHCREGEPHGLDFYRVWREGDRVRKVYVPLGDVGAVRAACEAHRGMQERLRAARAEREALTRRILVEWRRARALAPDMPGVAPVIRAASGRTSASPPRLPI
jgi:hypothetical protein